MSGLDPAASVAARDRRPIAVSVNEPPVSGGWLRDAAIAVPCVLRHLRERGELLRALALRDLKAKYQASGLGYVWSLLNPLLMLLIYGWVFSSVLRVGVPDFALFLACGLLPWTWTSEALAVGTGSLVANAAMLRRVHTPVEVLPVVTVLVGGVHFLLSLPVLLAFLIAFDRVPSVEALALPAVIGAQLVLNAGLAMATSTLNVRFRDLQLLVSSALLFLLFAAPIVYPLEQVPADYRALLRLNPFTPLAVAYQDVLFHGRWPDPGELAYAWVFAALVFWVGAFIVQRRRWSIAEEL